ncbi:MAG TPA: aminotransferase class I/II-fold pyridoxal phosphate-dependent enzyme [Gaiellaceae bacterium]|jgi:acetylornithine aminotransferase|nr:aminotransferase class I/II-fold pyridoxal phosphate-dependent enzyme [Gaiellaceae bacterium]
MHVSPVLTAQAAYPFVRIEQAKRDAAAAGVEIFDFGQGDPREPTDPLIREALVDALAETRGYPKAEGLPELREAIAGWASRRFGVSLDPATDIVPTLGSKEAIFSFAQVVLDPERGKDTVLVTEPGYPVPERGGLFAGARVVHLPLVEDSGFLPDLDALDDDLLARAAILWLNYPNNPTAAVAPLTLYERAAALAAEHDFLVASDEAYSELWFAEPPPSALQVDDTSNVVVFNTLSKRSSMTGYRSGFVAGTRWVMDALRAYRPTVGTAPQEFVQRASIAAWGDEGHVERARDVYRLKRELLLGAFDALGWRVAGKDATMYLWVEAPMGESSESFAERLLRVGVVVAPGAYLGSSGEGYVRFALVPTVEDCERAAAVLRGLG